MAAGGERDPRGSIQAVVPCMVATGDGDRAWSVAMQKVAASLGGDGAEVVNLVGVGHTAPFEDAAAFNAALGEFLDRHRLLTALLRKAQGKEKQSNRLPVAPRPRAKVMANMQMVLVTSLGCRSQRLRL